MTANNATDHQVTQYNIITGGASNLLNNVAPSGTSGVPVISQGAASQPVFGTAVVAGGGTGRTTLTNHGVLVGAATAAITQLAAGTTGQVLQSGGASADPAYSTPTYPSTSGSSRKILVSDGTNNVYSTETWAVPGSSGNVLTSDGTNWTSAAASGGGILIASGTLTSAQIKALHATPIQAIAAPGAGKVIVTFSWIAKLNYGGTNAFVDGGGSGINLAYATSSVIAGNILASSTLTSSSSKFDIQNLNGVTGNAYATFSNAALNLYNIAATEITGNAAGNNTVQWQVMYYIATI